MGIGLFGPGFETRCILFPFLFIFFFLNPAAQIQKPNSEPKLKPKLTPAGSGPKPVRFSGGSVHYKSQQNPGFFSFSFFFFSLFPSLSLSFSQKLSPCTVAGNRPAVWAAVGRRRPSPAPPPEIVSAGGRCRIGERRTPPDRSRRGDSGSGVRFAWVGLKRRETQALVGSPPSASGKGSRNG